MNSTTIGIVVLVMLVAGLVAVAGLLDRRSKRKGDLITGQKHQQPPGARMRFYSSLLVTLIGGALLIWGVLVHSWLLIILGVIIFIASIAFRYYWNIRKLIEDEKRQGNS
ncbi:MAG: hypothetical protein HY865_09270 [Chloroflexi bacterium]|nr:hypothetical protein [Chloroflexota bacterium]